MKKRRLVMPRRGKSIRVARTARRTWIFGNNSSLSRENAGEKICLYPGKPRYFCWAKIIYKNILWSPISNMIIAAMRNCILWTKNLGNQVSFHFKFKQCRNAVVSLLYLCLPSSDLKNLDNQMSPESAACLCLCVSFFVFVCLFLSLSAFVCLRNFYILVSPESAACLCLFLSVSVCLFPSLSAFVWS